MPAPRTASYNIARVLALRDRLTEDLVVHFSQEEGSPRLLDSVVPVVLKHLPGKIDPSVLRDSLVDLIGRPLERGLLRLVAWRLAGNLARLKRSKAALPWLRQTVQETSPALILHVERLTREQGKQPGKQQGAQKESGGRLTFEVLAGSQAGLRLRKYWSLRFASKHRKVFGFARNSRRPEKLSPTQPFLGFEDLRQLAGLRLSLQFSPESCRDGLDFDGFSCPPAALEHNRKLLLLRTRVELPCPASFSHPCHLCWVGSERCRAACHPVSFVQQPCLECQRVDAYFDPAVRRALCVDCAARKPVDRRDLA
jgi:hypothetical protein